MLWRERRLVNRRFCEVRSEMAVVALFARRTPLIPAQANHPAERRRTPGALREQSVQRAPMAADTRFCQSRRMIQLRFFLAVAPLVAVGVARADTYRFDPVHTQVWFSADHQRFSHPQGRLRVKDGWFAFDAKDWSQARVDVEIDMTSADMGDAKWSDMVRGGQFFDAARYPTARFTSKSVEKNDATHGVIHGDLTFHGTTKPIDVDFTLNRVGNDPYAFKQKAGFSARAVLHRSAFGIKRYVDVVGEDIELRFEIEGIRDGDAAKNEAPAQNQDAAPTEEKKSDGD
jgi:polyisoprenoid-binding protein YceI